jgi:CopG antitoxin of type II toxin-antitoxin system
MKTRDPIPAADSINELAEFWQSHDLTDYEDLMEEVPGPLLVRKSSVKVPLKSGEAKTLQKMAEAKGLSPAELIHAWVTQKITRHKNSKKTKRN